MTQLCSWLCWFESLTLIAGQGQFVHMGRRFRRGGSNVDPLDLLLVLFVCVLIGLAIWGLSRFIAYRERRSFNSQRALFRELCRVHGLEWSGCRLLWQLARGHRMTRPADLFIAPSRFDLPDDFGSLPAHQDEIDRLRDRLFAAEKS